MEKRKGTWKTLVCKTCHKEFERECSHAITGLCSRCSKTLRHKNYKRNKAKRLGMNKENPFYSPKKDSFKDKIIPYSESPSGKAYVGVNKEPFMPAADNGHGFQGVLIQNDDRDLIQCHTCGVWMSFINGNHLISCSGMTSYQYKEKYGFNIKFGLVSDELALQLTKNVMRTNRTRSRVVIPKSTDRRRRSRSSVQYQNSVGTCPLQIKERTYDFIRCNHQLPTQSNRGRQLARVLRQRFGSEGHGFQSLGLPWRKSKHSKDFIFPDCSVEKYNIQKFEDRERFYNDMIAKCPELAQ